LCRNRNLGVSIAENYARPETWNVSGMNDG
jgi:hypothetical protein